MRAQLQYGTDNLDFEVPSSNVTVLAPRPEEGLPDEAAAFREAVRQPIGSAPLGEIVGADEKLAVVIPDITRALPRERLLPWLFEELSHVRPENVTIVNGTGSHRANTGEELAAMVGRDVYEKYRVVNHDAHDPDTLLLAGRTPEGRDVYMNREYVEADRRIVMGFIEPHFMAGFSGGYKGVFPAVADVDSIMHYHRAAVIGHGRSTWGVMEDNPTQDQIRQNGSLLPLDFCINVTLNRARGITGFYCGDPIAAHEEGCEASKASVMVPCGHEYPIVVTSGGGYPLDQNLYQAVKGMSAAAQIVSEGGLIISAARCNDGFPAHGNFRDMLLEHNSPEAMLETIYAPGFQRYDQWQVQLFAHILQKARVALHSDIPPEDVRNVHLEPVDDVAARIGEELEKIGPDAPIAILPEGPMAVPYLEQASIRV
ncbi:MAG: Transcriptional regulator [uncultured Rubrobacteraceae bacterium]|uniref:Transcriptional regulator n=1 Tax=uncultured Rubrobacteraceae bacterium TaxID=349277 RepID=A0A6J4PBU7_9ACTN|nr:MAG: Transcriptional regulator [uncultured Rubrobacteraceae bacterium]